MLVVLEQGGFTTGGLNFDAKVRRESFEPVDLFHAHIGGMDAFARGLEDRGRHPQGRCSQGVRRESVTRTWDTGIGPSIENGKAKFEELEAYMLKKGEVAANVSGRQEMLENVINR